MDKNGNINVEYSYPHWYWGQNLVNEEENENYLAFKQNYGILLKLWSSIISWNYFSEKNIEIM